MLYAFGSVIAASRMRPMVANCSAVHGLESESVRVVKRSRKELGDGVLAGAFCAQQFNTKNAATIGEAKKHFHRLFPVGSFSVEKPNQWNDLAFLTLLCGLRHYFIGEKSVDRMYVRSIFSTSLLACSDLIAS